MEQNDLAYDAVAKEDVQRLRAQLQAVPVFAQQPGMGMGGSAVVDVTRTQFFRIPFTQVQQQQRQRLGLGLVADTEKRGARRQREMCHHSTHSTIQYSHPSPPPTPRPTPRLTPIPIPTNPLSLPQALDLVAHRQVFLEQGLAYVPVERLVSIIVARFRATLSRGLLDAFSSYPYILADTR